MSANESVETTFLIPAENRCSFTAISDAVMSFFAATVNASSVIVPSLLGSPAARSVKSCWAAWPAVTVMVRVSAGKPV